MVHDFELERPIDSIRLHLLSICNIGSIQNGRLLTGGLFAVVNAISGDSSGIRSSMFILGAAAARAWSDLSRAVLRNSSFIILICNEKSAEKSFYYYPSKFAAVFLLWRWRIFPCRSGCPPVPRERYCRYSHLTLPRPPALFFSVHPSREYPHGNVWF